MARCPNQPHPHTPDYRRDYPDITHDFHSDPTVDFGWIHGLYLQAMSTMGTIFGRDDKLQLNPDNLKNSKFETDFGAHSSVLGYIIIWTIIGLLIPCVGGIWCCCVECCCCCMNAFEKILIEAQRKARILAHQQHKSKKRVEPEASEETVPAPAPVPEPVPDNSKCRIVAIVFMSIWLLFLFLIIVYAFGAAEETRMAIANVQKDIQHAFDDTDKYMEACMKQFEFLFLTTFERLNKSIHLVMDDCDPNNRGCGLIRINVTDPVRETKSALQSAVNGLKDAVKEVREGVSDAGDSFDKLFEEHAVNLNKYLYWFLTLCNILYLFIFIAILGGLILAIVGKTQNLKVKGHQAIRWAIVFMFILPPFIIIQLNLIFAIGGGLTQFLCPAVRRVLDQNSSYIDRTNQTSGRAKYKPPRIGEVMGQCNADSSAYEAFYLHTVFNVMDLKSKTDEFRKHLDTVNLPSAPPPPSNKKNALETIEEIICQVEIYVEFVISSIQKEAGRCRILYNIVKTLMSMACEKGSIHKLYNAKKPLFSTHSPSYNTVVTLQTDPRTPPVT